MGVKVSENGTYITYGPYRDGDKLEFTDDPVVAMVSFDIFNHKVRNSKLYHPSYSKIACLNEADDELDSWTVVTSKGTVGDYIENLYFMFPIKPEDTVNPDSEDEVNHPKHYTGHKADIECIMFTELLPSLASNAFKYVWRCDDKGNREEDLKKACWYLQRINDNGFYEKRAGWKVRAFMLEIIEASDFDDWHKTVLANIVRGCYCTAQDNISRQLEDCDDISSQLEYPDFF